MSGMVLRFDSPERRGKSSSATEPGNDEYRRMAEPLAAWLTGRLDDATHVEVGTFDRPSGGYSAETLIVPVTVATHSSTAQRTIVLRREMPQPPVYPVQVTVENEIELQWRVMSALAAHAEVPIASLIGYESGTEVLGSPFFVMDFVAGDIPREDPPYVLTGFYAQARAAERDLMGYRCNAAETSGHSLWRPPPSAPRSLWRLGNSHQPDRRNLSCTTSTRPSTSIRSPQAPALYWRLEPPPRPRQLEDLTDPLNGI